MKKIKDSNSTVGERRFVLETKMTRAGNGSWMLHDARLFEAGEKWKARKDFGSRAVSGPNLGPVTTLVGAAAAAAGWLDPDLRTDEHRAGQVLALKTSWQEEDDGEGEVVAGA